MPEFINLSRCLIYADPWPEPPAGWGPGDAARAGDYLDHTDVVVWTPRMVSGRALSFQPLPDFAPVRESADEFVSMYVNDLTRDYGDVGRRALDELLRRADAVAR